MPRHRIVSRIALVCAIAAGVAGCGSAAIFDKNEAWFSKPVEIFNKPDWARATGNSKVGDLGPSGPVAPEDLVGPDGRCGAAAEVAQASAPPPATPAAQADRPVGSVAGDLAGAPMPAGNVAIANPAGPEASPPPVLGGIALGMTECQAVRRAGDPGNVAISAGEKGERQVVLTYLSGTWPGIYRFNDGRLKVIERAPAPPEPAKKPPKKKTTKKKPASAKTSQRDIERPYVQ